MALQLWTLQTIQTASKVYQTFYINIEGQSSRLFGKRNGEGVTNAEKKKLVK